VTINRFCSSGLQAIAFASERVMCGSTDVVVAGGDRVDESSCRWAATRWRRTRRSSIPIRTSI
jgi:acetyl-CoA acetyltransferase